EGGAEAVAGLVHRLDADGVHAGQQVGEREGKVPQGVPGGSFEVLGTAKIAVVVHVDGDEGNVIGRAKGRALGVGRAQAVVHHLADQCGIGGVAAEVGVEAEAGIAQSQADDGRRLVVGVGCQDVDVVHSDDELAPVVGRSNPQPDFFANVSTQVSGNEGIA